MSDLSASRTPRSITAALHDVVERVRVLMRRRRRLRPTRAGWTVLAITLAVGFAAINTGNNLLFFGWGLLLSSIVVSGILSENTLRSVQLRLGAVGELRVGARGDVPVAVQHAGGRFPAFGVQIAVALRAQTQPTTTNGPRSLPAFELRISPHERCVTTTHLQPLTRGAHVVERLVASTAYPFGFFEKSRGFDDDRDVVLVAVPARVAVGEPLRALLARLGESPARTQGHGDEFFSLRPFRTGDDPRSVNWRRTARTGRVVVVEHESSRSREVVLDVVLAPENAETHDDNEDVIATTASLAEDLLDAGHAVGVRGPGVSVPAARGARQRAHVLHELALLDVSSTRAAPAPARHCARVAVLARGTSSPSWADASVAAVRRPT